MDERQKALDLLAEFETAMLVTRGVDGDFDARPMQTAAVDQDGTIWFITGRSTRKVDDVARDPRVAVVCQDGRRYLSLRGSARAVADPARVRQLWKEPYRVWFPQGVDDPDVTLLAVQPQDVEYWDNAGLNGVRYLVKAARAYVAGERPAVKEGDEHGRAELS